MNDMAHLVPAALPDSIFRAYDIRGVVGKTLHAETAYWIGRAIGAQSLAQGEPQVSVGRDGRLSGPMLVEQLIKGLVDAGCQVSDVGLVPTPALYYAANVLAGKSGVMLTGSHNPPDYNGFKIMIAGETLANEQITALHTRIQSNDLASGVGSLEAVDVLDRYFREIRDDIAMASFVQPGLSTVQQDTKQAGDVLVDSLIRLIQGEAVESRTLPVRLVLRGSSGGG